MRSMIVFVVITVVIGVTAPAAAQPRCWDTGHSIRCPPGCEVLKLPDFPGDIYTWRCRRPAPPPPPVYSYEPPPASCPPDMYEATETWCCPFGTIYDSGSCRSPERRRTYEAGVPNDPTPMLILVLIGLGLLAWYDHHSRQVAYARETADALGDTDDIAAVAQRMHEAADRADEILRQFRNNSEDDA